MTIGGRERGGGEGPNVSTVADGGRGSADDGGGHDKNGRASSVGWRGGRGWAVDDDGFHHVCLLVVHLIAGGCGGVMTILVGCLLLREPIEFFFFLGVFFPRRERKILGLSLSFSRKQTYHAVFL